MKENMENYMPKTNELVRNRAFENGSKLRSGDAVLMIINAQNEYLDGALAIPNIGPAISEISKLLDRARKADTPVMFLQHVDRPGGLFDPVGHGGQFIDKIAPDNDEHILQKTMPNGFAVSNLEQQLKQIGRKKLIISGFMTHMCVSFTARAAAGLGYEPCVVANACAAAALRESDLEPI